MISSDVLGVSSYFLHVIQEIIWGGHQFEDVAIVTTGHTVVLYIPNVVVKTVYAIGMRFRCLPETIRTAPIPELVIFV